MSSPIHKYLFSPPSSPTAYPVDRSSRLASPAFESLATLLPPDLRLLPTRSSTDGNELKIRSPRTPQSSRFTLDSAFPSPPRRSVLAREETFKITIEDVSTPSSPNLNKAEKEFLPANVPSVPTHSSSISLSIPRPLLRLFLLMSIVISSICILVYIPSARLPSLRDAAASRRLALASDGRAYLDVVDPVTSWQESKDREYVPPQIIADRIHRRSVKRSNAASGDRISAPPPKANRPSARPLPRTHEFYALQSYVLQSTYNVLPAAIDGSTPLDANLILGFNPSEAALAELEAERAKEVIVWYGADGQDKVPHDVLAMLQAIHGANRHPTLVPMHGRPDRQRLVAIFDRLEIPMQNGAVVMIGNTPVKGDVEEIEELRASGKLAQLMETIGWTEKKPARQPWKPKHAKAQKRSKSEVERALEQAKQAKHLKRQ